MEAVATAVQEMELDDGDHTGIDTVSANAFHLGTTELIKRYFGKHGFFRQQMEGFNHFMEIDLPNIVASIEPLTIVYGSNKVVIKFLRTTILPMYQREADGHVRPVYPDEARQRKLTYQNSIVVDIEQQCFFDEKATGDWVLVREYEFLEVPLMRVPCMVRSKFCRLHNVPPDGTHDFIGGYFIVNGQEKVVQAQIKLRANSIHVFKAGEHAFYAEVRSTNDSAWKATSSIRVNVKAKSTQGSQFEAAVELPGSDGVTTYRIPCQMPHVFVTLPFVSTQVPFATFCRLLGVTVTMEMLHRACRGVLSDAIDRDVVNLIFSTLVRDPHAQLSDTELVELIGREGTREKTPERRAAYVSRMLNDDVLPHIGVSGNLSERCAKVMFVVLMTVRVVNAFLLSTLGNRVGDALEDDRDNWRFKKVDSTGSLIAVLVRQLLRTFVASVKSGIFKALEMGTPITTIRVIDGFINARKLETNIRYHFATGTWTVMRGVSASACTGVCAPLTRITPIATISAANRINCPVNRDGKTSTPRLLHPSDWGNSCCVETPEGSGCGLVLNFCALTHVRLGYETVDLCDVVSSVLGLLQVTMEAWIGAGIPVFVNGMALGLVAEQDCFNAVRALKAARVTGLLPFDTSIVHYFEMSIVVNGDVGVCLRPVVVAGKFNEYCQLLTHLVAGHLDDADPWTIAMQGGMIEYIDTEEQIEHCVVATTLESYLENPDKFSHLEVQVNFAIMGITAGLIPFADFNQSPRVIYQSSMGKQAIGNTADGVGNRLDSNMYQLHYPQRPLCQTTMADVMDLDGFSSSTEALLMIGSIDGFNQEDSILLNKASNDRGFARVTSYRTYFDELNCRGNDEETFSKVSSAALMKARAVTGKSSDKNYALLDDDGFAYVGARVRAGDVLIGKTAQSMELGPDGKHVPIRRDRSTVAKEDGIVDKVIFTTGREGKAQVRIRVRQLRVSITGDKYVLPSGVFVKVSL